MGEPQIKMLIREESRLHRRTPRESNPERDPSPLASPFIYVHVGFVPSIVASLQKKARRRWGEGIEGGVWPWLCSWVLVK